MTPHAIKYAYVGKRQPERPWLPQIISDDGMLTETLSSEHTTEKLALAAAAKEIAKRLAQLPERITPAQRARVDELKAQRAKLTSPIDRIAFDNRANALTGDESVLHLIAMLESK
jgi:hypothetical protein